VVDVRAEVHAVRELFGRVPLAALGGVDERADERRMSGALLLRGRRRGKIRMRHVISPTYYLPTSKA
jgi:hypothetical protein